MVPKTILYLNPDADTVNAEMLMPRFPRALLHVTSWNSDQVEISSRAEIILGYMDTSTALRTRIFQSGLNSKTPFQYVYTSWYINKNHCEILKMRRQKNMEKKIFVLSSALTTCLLLLQCFSILTLKIMRVRSRLSISDK